MQLCPFLKAFKRFKVFHDDTFPSNAFFVSFFAIFLDICVFQNAAKYK